MISTTWILYTSLIFNTGAVDNYHERLFTKDMCLGQAAGYWQKFYISGMDQISTQDLVCVNEKNPAERIRIICDRSNSCTHQGA